MFAQMRVPAAVLLSLALVACNEEPINSGNLPEEPAAPAEGIQAFLQVSDTEAEPGEAVRVYVRVQLPEGSATKLGSYTGEIRFDPRVIELREPVDINDGLRVTNPEADAGRVRFAGAAPNGFGDLTLFEGEFVVRGASWRDALSFQMSELSAAMTMSDLTPSLQVAPQIFLRTAR